MNFYQRPFLFIVPVLILGILCGILLPEIEVWIISTVIVAGIAFLMHLYEYKTFFFSIILLTFLSIGGIVSTLQTETFDEPISSSIVLEVLEQPISTNSWKKGIGKVIYSKYGKNYKKINQELLFYSKAEFQKGDILYVNSEVNLIENKNNPGEFDAESYWSNKGIRYMAFIGEESYQLLENRQPNWIESTLSGLRTSITKANIETLGPKYGGVLNAMMLGDKSSLDQEITQSFSNAGAMHVLAVSGLHVGIILMILIYVLSKVRFLSRNQVYIVSIFCVWIYALITGFSPSVVRASLMFTILFGAQIYSRKSDSINALFFSAFILLVLKPSILFDIGFQLSYLAVLGILLLNPVISKLVFLPNKWLQKAWEGSAVGISAQVFTIPLSLYYFHQFPNYFVLTNIAVMVFAGVILTLGLLLMVVQNIKFVVGLLKVILGVTLASLLFVVQFVESLPGAVASGFDLSPNVVLFMYTIIATGLLFYYQKKVFWMSAFLFILVIGVMQYFRYQQMSESHLIFLNHSKPLIVMKNGSSSTCFCMPEDDKKYRVIEDYLKVYPSKISFVEIYETKGLVDNNSRLSVFKLEEGIAIHSENHSFFLQTGYRTPRGKYDGIFTMGYLKNSLSDYSLESGAIKLTLESII